MPLAPVRTKWHMLTAAHAADCQVPATTDHWSSKALKAQSWGYFCLRIWSFPKFLLEGVIVPSNRIWDHPLPKFHWWGCLEFGGENPAEIHPRNLLPNNATTGGISHEHLSPYDLFIQMFQKSPRKLTLVQVASLTLKYCTEGILSDKSLPWTCFGYSHGHLYRCLLSHCTFDTLQNRSTDRFTPFNLF